MINVAVIGSSGSIGMQTLNIIRRMPHKFKIVALTVFNSFDALIKQAEEFNPLFVGVGDETLSHRRGELPKSIDVRFGIDAASEAASLPQADIVVVAASGMSGLPIVLAAARSGKRIALANKESLVAGGEIVLNAVKENKAEIIPVDSEHSAVWQVMTDENRRHLKRIILTASGGAFFNFQGDFSSITPAQATRNPNWSMGAKISVDSSTMFNKGLEIIEARWLFDTFDIDYVIHRESIIHSMIELDDGSVLAQMANPDMEIPIQLALTYPDRLPSAAPPLDFKRSLTFCPPDEKKFPAPTLAKAALYKGGNLPCAITAADDVAVAKFLEGKIKFTDINNILENTLLKTEYIQSPTEKDIFATYKEVTDKLMRDYK